MNRYICIHCHFYQPPRENPWLEAIELQDSAYPYHDWNERITAECYGPNTASRILDSERKIIDIVNNYTKVSFNFGPTLLSWLEKHKPEIYETIIEADKENQKKFSGHGSAIGQVYNHMIMPLANSRDKRIQIIWGIKDFEYRFGRKPEGMWLAEAAVDLETLDLLAKQGIKFTILAPSQAQRIRRIGDKKWKNVTDEKIDPKLPYLCKLPSGRTISLFFYDGPIARDVAFGELLQNGEVLANRLLGAFSENQELPQIVDIATDGETYGHHHRFGDMALAYCLYHIESKNLARITVYGEYLSVFGEPTHEVEIIENSSWSCIHGIERWRSNCGCNTGMHPDWQQEWREPLRRAMDWLRNSLIPIYEAETTNYLKDPWQARDDYISIILNRIEENVERFFAEHAKKELSKPEKVKVLRLLEMERHSMLMYTSCGWFFDEISGIETVQVMQYAARAMQLAKEVAGIDLEGNYIKILEAAQSNLPEFKNGGVVYEKLVKPAVVDSLRVVSHFAISSLFAKYPETVKIYCYTANIDSYDRLEAGTQKLAIGKAKVRSDITWREDTVNFAVLYFGDSNLIGGVGEFGKDESRPSMQEPEEQFSQMQEAIKSTFTRNDIPEIIRLMDNYFGTHNYSLWHLFRDEQRKIFNQILDSTLKDIETSFRQIFERDYPILTTLVGLRIPVPKGLLFPAEFILNTDIRRLLESSLDGPELDLEKLEKLIAEIKNLSPSGGLAVDKTTLGFVASQRIETLMQRVEQTPGDMAQLERVAGLFRILEPLRLDFNLWKAQNVYFAIGKKLYAVMRESAEKGEPNAKKWVEHFDNLSNYLYVKIH